MHVTDSNGVYAQVVNVLNSIKRKDYVQESFSSLLCRYSLTTVQSTIETTASEFRDAIARVNNQYPLLERIDRYRTPVRDIAHYINLIDKEVN